VINFKLRELDKIAPWGEEPELSLHWFGLTDGDLWLTFGNETIYEYSRDAMNYLGNKPTPYNDYQLSRFIEDFTQLFDKISETIPEEFYELTTNLKMFHSVAEKWLDICDTGEDNYSDFYLEEYNKLISWTFQRTLNSGHLIGGPHLSFFRRNDKLRIVWDTEHFLENGISLWTAKNGSFEMNYADFVNEIKAFGLSFFAEMRKQVELTVAKDWGQVKVDKPSLIEEHEKREKDFHSSVALLEQKPFVETDWIEIDQLFKRMKNIITNA
jgi:hypothetical protein